MNYLLTQPTRDRLMRLLSQQVGDAPHHGRVRAPLWVMVRCDIATAIGGDAVLDECYPATLFELAANTATPPDEQDGTVLLTLLGDSGDSVAPRLNGVYECLLTDEVLSDASGSVAGRRRAFGVAPASSPLTYDCKSLGGILIVSGSNGTWYTYGTDTTTVSSGDELVIPSAGNYEISVFGVITGKMNTGAPGEFLIRVWDSVAAAPILFGDPHSGTSGANQTIAAQFGANNVPQENVVSYTFFASLAGTERLSVQFKRDTGTWWYSNFGSPSTGAVSTLLRYLKVG